MDWHHHQGQFGQYVVPKMNHMIPLANKMYPQVLGPHYTTRMHRMYTHMPVSWSPPSNTTQRMTPLHHAAQSPRQRDVEAAVRSLIEVALCLHENNDNVVCERSHENVLVYQEWLMMLSKSPSPDTFAREEDLDGMYAFEHTDMGKKPSHLYPTPKIMLTPPKQYSQSFSATASVRKRTDYEGTPKVDARKRLCPDFSHNMPSHMNAHEAWRPISQRPAESEPVPAISNRNCDFMIHGTQGNLPVCVRKVLKRGGGEHAYMLVRLRGQSNTLSLDARLQVTFKGVRPPLVGGQLRVHIARVRIKAGVLKYDFLSNACALGEMQSTGGGLPRQGRPESGRAEAMHSSPAPQTTTCTGRLQQSIFSKKCWSGVVVRGPRMFVAFVEVGGVVLCHSVPMFVEISPTQSTPGYRDPVGQYSDKLIAAFFAESTITKLGRLHHSQQQHTAH